MFDGRVVLVMVPRIKRDAIVRAVTSAWTHERWVKAFARERLVKAVGAGSLVLSPLSLTAGVLVAWPAAPHVFQVAAAGAVGVDPQYGFGFLSSSPGGGIGVTGKKAKSNHPSPAVIQEARNLADHASKPALPAGRLGIPGIVLEAYQQAAGTLGSQDPGCRLPWWLLAGIGKVESDHADDGAVDAQGTTLFPILGPALDGTGGNEFDPVPGGGFVRARGPMQFLPSTWVTWGGGGNIDNVFAAALAAGRYLCANGRDLNSDPAEQATAVWHYNPSDSYVHEVLNWAYAYASGAVPEQTAALPTGRIGGGGGGGGGAHGGSGLTGSGPGGSGSSGSTGSGAGSSGSGSTGSGPGSTGSGSTGSGGSPSASPTSPAPDPTPTADPTGSSTPAPQQSTASSTG